MPSQLAQLVRTTNILDVLKEHINALSESEHINALSESDSLELAEDDKKFWEESFTEKFKRYLEFIGKIDYIKEKPDEAHDDPNNTKNQQNKIHSNLQSLSEICNSLLNDNQVEQVNFSSDGIIGSKNFEIKSKSTNQENTGSSNNYSQVIEAVERFKSWSSDTQGSSTFDNDILQLDVNPLGADLMIICDGMTIFVDLKIKKEDNKIKPIWTFFPPLFDSGDGQRDE